MGAAAHKLQEDRWQVATHMVRGMKLATWVSGRAQGFRGLRTAGEEHRQGEEGEEGAGAGHGSKQRSCGARANESAK